MISFDEIKKRGFVLYSDFGAVGDGVTEDFEAIKAAHGFANEWGLPVFADEGATYYIEKKSSPAVIKTDTDWRGATFIIDDTRLTEKESCYTFAIDSDEENVFYEKDSELVCALNSMRDECGIAIRGINHGENKTKKLPIALGYKSMIRIYDDESIAYNRYGYVDSRGSAQEEVFLVDENGNIDPQTTALIDYAQVTRILVHKTEIKPICIKNASFRGLASLVNVYGKGGNMSTGIRVARPNTTLEGIVHTVENERPRSAAVVFNEKTGLWEDAPEGYSYDFVEKKVKFNGETYTGDKIKPYISHTYTGFIAVAGTYNVLIKDCVFQGRTYYNSGTYDISCYYSSHVVFENCTQSNYYDPRDRFKVYGESTVPNLSLCWGIMGSNYCKNIDFINCTLTRFDAHRGVYNGRIMGGKMGVLRLIGGGEFLLDGVEIARLHETPLQLRSDYGGTFNGTLTVKNCVFKNAWESYTGEKSPIIALLDAPSPNWDFGYETYFPNLVIDNIKIDTIQTDLPLVKDSGTVYNPQGSHYPLRSLAREDVHNPEAKFTSYYETRDPEVQKNHPERFPFLKGWEGECEILEHKNKTYTLIHKNVKNINPHHPPRFIEIRNMKGALNANGEPLTLSLFDCSFFSETKIIDKDGVLLRNKVNG